MWFTKTICKMPPFNLIIHALFEMSHIGLKQIIFAKPGAYLGLPSTSYESSSYYLFSRKSSCAHILLRCLKSVHKSLYSLRMRENGPEKLQMRTLLVLNIPLKHSIWQVFYNIFYYSNKENLPGKQFF